MEQFTTWLTAHHPDMATRIVGSVVVDEHHLSEGQLLEKARKYLQAAAVRSRRRGCVGSITPYFMNTNPQDEGAIILHSTGIGTVTRKMVRERAVELALIAGRPAIDVSKSDWEQAKQQLTGS